MSCVIEKVGGLVFRKQRSVRSLALAPTRAKTLAQAVLTGHTHNGDKVCQLPEECLNLFPRMHSRNVPSCGDSTEPDALSS